MAYSEPFPSNSIQQMIVTQVQFVNITVLCKVIQLLVYVYNFLGVIRVI